jgi:VanZ family protein
MARRRPAARLRLWAPVWIYMAAIFYASAQPDVSIPGPLSDTSWHSIAYTGLGVLIVRALAGGLGAPVAPSAALLGIVLTTAYGCTDELHQMFVPGRYADLRDVAADATGGAIGAFLCWLCGIISRSWPLKT